MPGSADKGQDLGRSCEAHPGGPGACFGPEVTRVLGCGQLGPMHSFYSWVLGSGTKYGAAWDWHSPLGQAQPRVAHPACPAGPAPTHPAPRKSQITPTLRGLREAGTWLCPTLSTPQCGSRGVKNTQDQNSLSLQWKTRAGEHGVLDFFWLCRS